MRQGIYRMAKDYYEILGVQKSANTDEIKSAYKKLAKKYHPDLYATASDQDKKNAEEKFKEVNHAYEVLSDDQKRAAYDTYGDENGPQMGAGGSGFGGFGDGFGFNVDDIFSTIFGGFGGGSSSRANSAQRGRDILLSTTITFEESYFGVQRIIPLKRVERCSSCGGTGAKDRNLYKTCNQCGGKGRVNTVQRTPFGQISQTITCPTCKGKGSIITDTCKECGGRGSKETQTEFKANILRGIDNGQRITYQNEGHAGSNGGPNGSVILEVKVLPHNIYKRRGNDIIINYPISFIDAALGTKIVVPTPEGKENITIPEGTQSGTEFRLRRKGFKDVRGAGYGDIIINVIAEIPKNLSRSQRKALEDLDFEDKQFAQRKQFKEKI